MSSEAIYRRLKALAESRRLDALTLRCFDLVTGLGATGCYALSRLADEGLDSGCEGDIPSIIGLCWLKALSGRPAWMANPSDVEMGEKCRILLAHCTVPRTMLDSYGVRSHFESGLGVAIAVALALHNIPEGISVSVPIFYATGDRRKAFLYSFFSGLAEPVGALAGYLGLLLFLGEGGTVPPQVMGALFAGVAGIMVYISVDELLPASRAYGRGHDSLFGLVAGMAVMALSLLLMR